MILVSHREATPNPNAFKYHTGTELVEGGLALDYGKADANTLPMARELFALGTVTNVMIAEDFVSVSATPDAEWDDIEGAIQRELATYSVADATRLAEEQAAARKAATAGQNENEMYRKIDALLDQYVRPALAGDGGGVQLLSVEDKIVTIRYQGACGSCPSSTAATMGAIENFLRMQVDPEIEVQPG